MRGSGGAALAVDIQEDTPLLRFHGVNFQPLPSGGLYWPAENALLVADLHLEKMSSFSRRGSFLPPYDTGLTLRRLSADVNLTGATTIISLGDSFHRDWGTESLLDADRLLLDGLLDRVTFIWLSGNHDPTPHALGGMCMKQLDRRGLTLTHHPKRGTPGLVAGHMHPAARVVINGRSVRRNCFVHDGRTMILPAYGSGAGSINILSAPFVGLLDFGALEVTMLGRDKVYPVSAKRLMPGG